MPQIEETAQSSDFSILLIHKSKSQIKCNLL